MRMLKMMKSLKRLVLLSFLMPQMLGAQNPKDSDEQKCKANTNVAETSAQRIPLSKIEAGILSLKDIQDRPLVNSISPDFRKALASLFDRDPKTISKLEQFYGLLFYLGKYKNLNETFIRIKRDPVRHLLLTAQVFSTPELPNHISEIGLVWSDHFERGTYEVKFDKKEIRLPLNGGKGFGSFREGLCQIAEALVFYENFQFNVERTRSGHVYVSDFKNVDLFGKFGSRGIVNVDLNYVSVLSVEFLSGSNMGTVRAKVAKREFDVNDHNWLLRMVTKFVTDKSTQPIDW
ncbi:MAG: hypothetical protein J0L93_07600 [Deltaproteobacteria bacterium]|nr:hypothetical protein [Deltaproteobacteria bacterium]